MTCANKDTFTSTFQLQMSLCPCLSALARTSSAMLKRDDGSDTLALFLMLAKKSKFLLEKFTFSVSL